MSYTRMCMSGEVGERDSSSDRAPERSLMNPPKRSKYDDVCLALDAWIPCSFLWLWTM